MLNMPRNELWMALPCWEELSGAHAPLMDEVGLRIWLAILAVVEPPALIPVSRFLFIPDEARSWLSCKEGVDLGNGLVEEKKTHACLHGQWLAEFDHRLAVSLGEGVVALEIIDSSDDAHGFGSAQHGYLEFGDALGCRGWITHSTVRKFFDLTGQTICSSRTMLDFSALIRLNDVDENLGSMFQGPRNTLCFSKIALTSAKSVVTTAQARPALLLRRYGLQKVAVVRLLMEHMGGSASEIMAKVGSLDSPFQIATSDSWDIGALFDMADRYGALGADVYVGPALETGAP